MGRGKSVRVGKPLNTLKAPNEAEGCPRNTRKTRKGTVAVGDRVEVEGLS